MGARSTRRPEHENRTTPYARRDRRDGVGALGTDRGKAGQQELRERLDGADTMSRGNEVAAFIAGCATGVVFVWVLVRLTVTVTPQDFRDLCDSLYDYAVSASDTLAIHREHPYCRIPEVTSTASHDLRSPRHADWRQSFEVRP